MEGLTASGLLEVYERGRREGPAEREALLLAAADAGGSAGGSAVGASELPLGSQNAFLLRLNACTFGEGLEGTVDCPGCGETLEIPLAVSDLLSATEAEPSWRPLTVDGFEVEVRP